MKPLSATDARATRILDETTSQNEYRYQVGMLSAADESFSLNVLKETNRVNGICHTIRSCIPNEAAKIHGQSLINDLLNGPFWLQNLIHIFSVKVFILYMPTSKESFSKMELSHMTDHHYDFRGVSTQQV